MGKEIIMNKKTLLVVVVLFIALGFIPVSSMPVFAEKNVSWQYAYVEFLGGTDGPYDFYSPETKIHGYEEIKYYNEMKPYFYFSLRDIDNNGIPELIVRWDQGAAGHAADVYTYSNGKVKYLGFYTEPGAVNATGISDNPKYPGLFSGYGRRNDVVNTYITIKNNELVEEIINGYGDDYEAIIDNPGLYAELGKIKIIPDYKFTGKDIANVIYNYGKSLGTHSHPYALALKDYLENEIDIQESYPVAYLEDINGDGVKEMLVGKSPYVLERLYYLHNGELGTYGVGKDFDADEYNMYFSSTKYLLEVESFEEGDYIYVLKLEDGKVIQKTKLLGIGYPINHYTQEDRMITEAEYMELAKKYGIDFQTRGNGKNQINEILSMTNTIKAIAMKSKIKVDGSLRELEAYSINGNNYFKLRDLAHVVNNTDKNFEVKWDGDKKAIRLTSKKGYTPVGGELSRGDGKDKLVQPTRAKVYKDGVEISLNSYSINGNSFFKLRDIAKAFDIGVTWDGKANTVGIDTGKEYTE